MNRLRYQRGFKRFNIVSVPIYLIVISAIYLGWKYLPVYWEKESLLSIAQNAILTFHRAGPDGIAKGIMEQVDMEHGRKLEWDHIQVRYFENHYEVEINYTVVINHLFGKKHYYDMSVKTKRKLVY